MPEVRIQLPGDPRDLTVAEAREVLEELKAARTNFTPAMLAAQQASNAGLPIDVRLKAALDAYELLHHERVRHGAMVERDADVANRARIWWRWHVDNVHPGVLPESGATLINLEGDAMYPAICDCPGGLGRLAESIQGNIEWGEMHGSG